MKKENQGRKRDVVISRRFRDDLRFWAETYRRVLIRALELIEAISRDPFKGIGKPEPLKHEGAGVWSRRLTLEHRITYSVTDDRIELYQARFHY